MALKQIDITAIKIRAFEEHLFELYEAGKLFGTIHTCIGQEFCAAALHKHLYTGKDFFIGTHRAHGHYLAHGGLPEKFLAELLGKEGALCAGRGGSQHLVFENFFSNGIQGASTPIGVGLAFSQKYWAKKAIVVVQIGDGTLGEGTIYEALTFSVLKKVPILFYVEINGFAQSTDTQTTLPSKPSKIFKSFGIDVFDLDDENPELLDNNLGKIISKVRKNSPVAVFIKTRRLAPHSKGDDNRDKKFIDSLKKNDPLTNRIKSNDEIKEALNNFTEKFRNMSKNIETMSDLKLSQKNSAAYPSPIAKIDESLRYSGPEKGDSVLKELNNQLKVLMKNRKTIVVGEDLADPYGGAFKVSKGLSSTYPLQVFSTPISEAGIAGFVIGDSIGGMSAIGEIMFGDFITLTADQLINSAAKFYYMYNGKIKCPLVLRIVSGGGRGYGPTHSQTLERIFCGIPGLKVVAPSSRHNIKTFLEFVVQNEQAPTIWVENKLLYLEKLKTGAPKGFMPSKSLIDRSDEMNFYENLVFVPEDRETRADITIVTYGSMLSTIEEVATNLIIEYEIYSHIIVLSQIWPLDISDIKKSVLETENLVVIEEGVPDYGFSSAVIAKTKLEVFEKINCLAIGSKCFPIPSAKALEINTLPSSKTIFADILRFIGYEK